MSKGRKRAPHHKEPQEDNVVMRTTDSLNNTASDAPCLGGMSEKQPIQQLSNEELAGLIAGLEEDLLREKEEDELGPVIVKNGWEAAINQIAEALVIQQKAKHSAAYYRRYIKAWVKWVNQGKPGRGGGSQMNIPPPITREQLRQQIEELKEELQSAKRRLKLRRMVLTANSNDGEKAKEVAEIELETGRLEEQIRDAKEQLRSLPLDDAPEEEQAWFGKIYANGSGYYVENDGGEWKEVNRLDAKTQLGKWHVSDRLDSETTPVDRALLAIQMNHKIEYAGPLAGYKAGRTKVNGVDVLVTSGTELIQPVEGPFPIINAILNGLFKEEREYFDAFCRVTYEGLKLCLETGKHSNGPVLVLAGPKHCGKSLVQYHILTPILGGRYCKPFLYISGQTSFNGDQAIAGHHMLEDDVPKNADVRRKVTNHIKKAAANKAVEVHFKGKDMKTLTPFTRLTVSVNDDEECLEVLPPLDDHMTDKILILQCHSFSFNIQGCVYPANTPAEQAVLEGMIEEEMPAYVHWLLNTPIPEHIKRR
jgi:Family of unknown function (DUF5906)